MFINNYYRYTCTFKYLRLSSVIPMLVEKCAQHPMLVTPYKTKR